jgi:hypothetical protein
VKSRLYLTVAALLVVLGLLFIKRDAAAKKPAEETVAALAPAERATTAQRAQQPPKVAFARTPPTIPQLAASKRPSLAHWLKSRSDAEVIASYSAEELEKAGFTAASMHCNTQGTRLMNFTGALSSEKSLSPRSLEALKAYAQTMMLAGRPNPPVKYEAMLKLERVLIDQLRTDVTPEKEPKAAALLAQLEGSLNDMQAGKTPNVAAALRRQELDYLDNQGRKSPKDDLEPDTHKEDRFDADPDDQGFIFESLDTPIARTISHYPDNAQDDDEE